MNKEIVKLENSITVKQHNFITEARYEMTALQKNIFYLLLAQLKDENYINNTYKLSIKQFKSIKNTRVNREEIRQAARGLMSSGLTVFSQDQEKFITIGILTNADYGVGHSRDSLIVEFDSRLAPFLYHVKNRFTTFTLSCALNLKSKYSKRIYEMLCQFKDTGVFKISVRELKERFRLINLETGKEEYIKFGLFAKKVLEVAKKEINEKTDISFTYISKKTGKKITDLEFYITYKPSNIKKPITPTPNLSISNEISQKQSDQLQKAPSKKEKEFEKLPLEQYWPYKRLKELALSKELATLVVKNIPIKELELEINSFCNSLPQHKNKKTITPHFQDLLYQYAGIRVKQNYKAGSTVKREISDEPLEDEKPDSTYELDPIYTFCFNKLRSFGINYADIQALLIQAPPNEIKIFLEKVSKELEENDEPNKANYVIKNFYTAFGSPHIKSSEQEKVQTLGEKLKNIIYTK